jgi:hypothetical protein
MTETTGKNDSQKGNEKEEQKSIAGSMVVSGALKS